MVSLRNVIYDNDNAYQIKAGRIAIQGLLAASLLGSAYTTANAQSVIATPVRSEAAATLQGVVSVRELAASQANLEALRGNQNAGPIEQPVHRLPDGSLTSAPSRETIEALPLTPEPNAAVVSQSAGSLFQSLIGFVGIHEGDNVAANGGDSEPPDQGLAVNNNVLAEINNNVIRFFNATTGAPLTGPMANSAFFGVPAGFNLSDTQVFFDPVSQRWIFDELMFSDSFDGFELAVSQTSDPLGKYFLYKLRAFSDDLAGCGGWDCLPDYPKMGYDANGFYITADLFSNVSNAFVEVAIYPLPKYLIEMGANFNYARLDDPMDFVVQPSVPAPGEPFSTANNGSEFLMSAPGSPNLAILAIDNTNNINNTPQSMNLLRTTVAAQAYGSGTVPSTQPNVIGPYCKSVGTTSAPSLDGGYSAFQATIQKANGGNLYGALPFGSNDGNGLNRDVIAWFEVQPTLGGTSLSAKIVNQGYVIPPGGNSISYPAFGLNHTGAGILGMTITDNVATFPSAAIVNFTGTATNSAIVIAGPGFTSDDGFSGCPKNLPGAKGRWGDYGAATVDAVTGFSYTANEMIPDPAQFTRGPAANWGTFITQTH